MRADGDPSVVAVASVIASALGTPASSAARYHALNCAKGSGSASFSLSTASRYCPDRRPRCGSLVDPGESAIVFGMPSGGPDKPGHVIYRRVTLPAPPG